MAQGGAAGNVDLWFAHNEDSGVESAFRLDSRPESKAARFCRFTALDSASLRVHKRPGTERVCSRNAEGRNP